MRLWSRIAILLAFVPLLASAQYKDLDTALSSLTRGFGGGDPQAIVSGIADGEQVQLQFPGLINQSGSNFYGRDQAAYLLDGRVRSEIVGIESKLDASAARVSSELQKRALLSRAQLFRLLHDEVKHIPGRGMRIISSDGSVLAWWGDDLRVSGKLTYQFDATDLYITRSPPL